MRYRRFTIRNYRAITGPMQIDVSKNSLIPIIGVNECGKTTILHAIFAFDNNNDSLNGGGRHLQDTTNLYSVNQDPPQPTISAEIELGFDEFVRVLKEVDKEEPPGPQPATPSTGPRSAHDSYRRLRSSFPGSIVITRDLRAKTYQVEGEFYRHAQFNSQLAKKIIAQLPFLLYFDDFRDSVENRVEILAGATESGWLDIFQTLFKKTNKSFSAYALPAMEERQRKSVLSKVNGMLNERLTSEWQNFRLDDTDALKIQIDYEDEPAPSKRAFLKLDVIEKDKMGDEHYFYVRDRSKGFFWFFNFVMKLEFNPKVVAGSDVEAIYLLDEPGSYLHAAAQEKLAKKLRQLSERNKVIYCTHSHHLLDPQVIPINTIRIAEKDGNGNVQLVPLHEHGGAIARRSAYQPLIDALQIRPLALDFGSKPTIIVEGIFDFYLLDLFRANREIAILPSVNAQSIEYHISLMIAWRVPYCALWDNDPAGRDSLRTAQGHFGEEEARSRFRLLSSGKAKNRILQNLVEGQDMQQIRALLSLPSNSSFEKTIAAWYYSRERAKILRAMSGKTRANFEQLFNSLPFKARRP